MANNYTQYLNSKNKTKRRGYTQRHTRKHLQVHVCTYTFTYNQQLLFHTCTIRKTVKNQQQQELE